MKKAEIEIKPVGMGLVEHNFPCPVFWESRKAVFTNPQNVFQPSWEAQLSGWRMVRADTKLKRLLLRFGGMQ